MNLAKVQRDYPLLPVFLFFLVSSTSFQSRPMLKTLSFSAPHMDAAHSTLTHGARQDPSAHSIAGKFLQRKDKTKNVWLNGLACRFVQKIFT